MRRILYIILLVLPFLAPVQRVDVGELLPVEAVALYKKDEQMVLETDSGNIGKGNTVEDALKDLKKKTPAVVYLDTARYLLIAPELEQQVQQIRTYLQPYVEVAAVDARGKVKEAMEYLEVHGNVARLDSIANG